MCNFSFRNGFDAAFWDYFDMMLDERLKEFYRSSPMREGILCWYPFETGKYVLDISDGALAPMLERRKLNVFGKDSQDKPSKFDYIVLIDPDDFTVDKLKQWQSALSNKGRLLMAFENPFALRYFSGKPSPVSKKPFGTITDSGSWPGMAEMQIRLKKAGFEGQKWYYPLSDHWFATEIYSDNHHPNEFLNQRFLPYVLHDDNILYDERLLYREVIRGGAFKFMCGAYLVEARVTKEDTPCPVDYVAVTSYRQPEKRFATTIWNDGTAQKTPLCPEGRAKMHQLVRNHEDLAKLGINVVEAKIQGDAVVMPLIKLPTLIDYWARKLADGTFVEDEMYRQFDVIKDAIHKSSANGKCYWEMVPANCFYDEANDEYLFFDQEYDWDGVGPEFAVARAIGAVVYSPAIKSHTQSARLYEALKERYGLTENWAKHVRLLRKTYEEVYDGDNAFALQHAARRRT